MRARSLASIAAGLAMMLAAPVAASELVTTGTVNMRTGAGVSNLRIATLPPGAPMSVDYCRKGWCLGSALGLRGWVSARYLSGDAKPQVESYQPPVIAVPPVPAVKFPFVMPNRGFHDYGLGKQHQFQRPIK
jgi:uncharacterized protein YraI